MAEGNQSWVKHIPKSAIAFLNSIEAEQRIKKIVRMGARHV
jgi:protein involved in ribonucleotide reduction